MASLGPRAKPTCKRAFTTDTGTRTLDATTPVATPARSGAGTGRVASTRMHASYVGMYTTDVGTEPRSAASSPR